MSRKLQRTWFCISGCLNFLWIQRLSVSVQTSQSFEVSFGFVELAVFLVMNSKTCICDVREGVSFFLFQLLLNHMCNIIDLIYTSTCIFLKFESSTKCRWELICLTWYLICDRNNCFNGYIFIYLKMLLHQWFSGVLEVVC